MFYTVLAGPDVSRPMPDLAGCRMPDDVGDRSLVRVVISMVLMESKYAVHAALALAFSIVLLSGCESSKEPVRTALRCQIRCAEHERFGFDGTLNTLTRLCAVARGDIWIETRRRTNELSPGEPESRAFLQQWVRPEDRIGEQDFIDVACASSLNPTTKTEEDLHVFGVTKDGRLLHSVSPGSPSLSPWTSVAKEWEDVEAGLGRDLGTISHVDAASRPYRTQLAVVASAEDGNAWYFENQGNWQHVRNIVADVTRAHHRRTRS